MIFGRVDWTSPGHRTNNAIFDEICLRLQVEERSRSAANGVRVVGNMYVLTSLLAGHSPLHSHFKSCRGDILHLEGESLSGSKTTHSMDHHGQGISRVLMYDRARPRLRFPVLPLYGAFSCKPTQIVVSGNTTLALKTRLAYSPLLMTSSPLRSFLAARTLRAGKPCTRL